MRRDFVRLVGALFVIIVGLALLSVTVSWAASSSLVVPVDEEQARLEAEVARLEDELRLLRRYDRALEDWIAEELRPWVLEQAEEVAEVLPPGVPTPSLDPLPPVPTPIPLPSPSPIPTDIPSPSVPPSPIPDPCLPVICSPSPGVMPGSISTGTTFATTISFVLSASW